MWRSVTRNGLDVKLTPKEFELLAFLARHAGKVVTHKQIRSPCGDLRMHPTGNTCASMLASCVRRSSGTKRNPR